MAWTSISPNGSVSVKSNLTIIGGNTTYIEQTMGNNTVSGLQQDHYWNIGANFDGRHRKVSMANFGSVPPVPGSLNGVYYVNNSPNTALPAARFTTGLATNQDWQLNAYNNVITGTFVGSTTSEVVKIVAIPPNMVGQIIIWLTTTPFIAMDGYFYSQSSTTNVLGYSGIVDWSGLDLTPRSPISLDYSNKNPGFLSGNVPSNSQFNAYRGGKTFNYVIFMRSAT